MDNFAIHLKFSVIPHPRSGGGGKESQAATLDALRTDNLCGQLTSNPVER